MLIGAIITLEVTAFLDSLRCLYRTDTLIARRRWCKRQCLRHCFLPSRMQALPAFATTTETAGNPAIFERGSDVGFGPCSRANRRGITSAALDWFDLRAALIEATRP